MNTIYLNDEIHMLFYVTKGTELSLFAKIKKLRILAKYRLFRKLTICFHWSLTYLKTFIFSLKRTQKTFSTQGLMPGFQEKIRFDFKKLKRSFSAALTQSSLESNLTTRKNGIFRISSVTNSTNFIVNTLKNTEIGCGNVYQNASVWILKFCQKKHLFLIQKGLQINRFSSKLGTLDFIRISYLVQFFHIRVSYG